MLRHKVSTGQLGLLPLSEDSNDFHCFWKTCGPAWHTTQIKKCWKRSMKKDSNHGMKLDVNIFLQIISYDRWLQNNVVMSICTSVSCCVSLTKTKHKNVKSEKNGTKTEMKKKNILSGTQRGFHVYKNHCFHTKTHCGCLISLNMSLRLCFSDECFLLLSSVVAD